MLTRFCGHRSIRVFLIGNCLIWVASTALLGQGQPGGWQARGIRGVVELVVVETADVGVTLSLRNVSGKDIAAVAVSCHGYKDYLEYFDSGEGLSAGQSSRVRISGQGFSGRGDKILEVSAVIFEDGTAKGLPSVIESYRLRRIGRMIETERLRRILNSPIDQHTGTDGVKALRGEIGNVPVSLGAVLASVQRMRLPWISAEGLRRLNGTYPSDLLAGVRAVRGNAILDVDRLARLPVSATDRRAVTQSGFAYKMREAYRQSSLRHQSFLDRIAKAPAPTRQDGRSRM